MALTIKKLYPNAKIRLEYCPSFDLNMRIDILVIIDEPNETIRGLRKAIWDYTNDISLEQDEVVSLILKSRKDYNRMRNTLFYQNVARDGIEL